MSGKLKELNNDALGTKPIKELIPKFAIPSIISMVVIAIYNITDQVFIGNVVGELGNAATNIAFPLINLITALSLMFGIGGSAAFNLHQGMNDKKNAPYFFGNSVSVMFILGVIIAVVSFIFLDPILVLFGATENIMPFAREYTAIYVWGLPLGMFASGVGHLLRADDRPTLTMVVSMTGVVVNIILDAWFVVGLDWGMAGAAWATNIGVFTSFATAVVALFKCKTFKLEWKHLIPKIKYFGKNMKMGISSFSNQICMMIVQIILNNSLNVYGGLSAFGSDIPIAVAGIVSKTGTIFGGITIGIAQGVQPLESYNYGAKKFERTKEAYYRGVIYSFVIAMIAFAIFQLFPEYLLAIFGKGSDLYVEFGCMWFRTYYFFACLFFFQGHTATLFTSIGKAWKGMFLALTRQVIYLIPLMLILPRFFGLDGIVYAQPIADGMAITTSAIMLAYEFNHPEFKQAKGVLKSIFVKEKKQNNQ